MGNPGSILLASRKFLKYFYQCSFSESPAESLAEHSTDVSAESSAESSVESPAESETDLTYSSPELFGKST